LPGHLQNLSSIILDAAESCLAFVPMHGQGRSKPSRLTFAEKKLPVHPICC